MATASQSIRNKIYGLENAKTATSRPRWTTEEDSQLLTLIKKKKPMDEIAALHNREIPGIRLRLKKLASDYYFYESRPIDEIQKLTTLSQAEIERAIANRKVTDPTITQTPRPVTPVGPKKKAVSKATTNPIVTSRLDDIIVAETPKAKQVEKKEEKQEQEPTMKDMMAILLALQEKVKGIVPDEPEPTMRDLMKIVKDIQKRMDTLIERVQ